MISAAAAADRADHAIEMKQIDALIEKHQAAKKWSGTAIKKWIADVISKIQSIQPGMTRADLIRLFDEDGGTLRNQSQYALRECAYIKIIVNFQLPGAAAGNEGWSHDRITTVSKPFLETPKPE